MMATGMSMRVMLIRELAASVHMGVIKGKCGKATVEWRYFKEAVQENVRNTMRRARVIKLK